MFTAYRMPYGVAAPYGRRHPMTLTRKEKIMAWVELLKREDCKKKMVEACEKSKTADYKNCAVYVNYNARNDYFYIDDFFDGGTITHFCNGERIL